MTEHLIHGLPAHSRFLSRVLVIAGLAIVVGGCIHVTPDRPHPLSQEPLQVDEAMVLRDWDQSTAYYVNGSVVAGKLPIPLMRQRAYAGMHVPPTHTAQPPLPVGPEEEARPILPIWRTFTPPVDPSEQPAVAPVPEPDPDAEAPVWLEEPSPAPDPEQVPDEPQFPATQPVEFD